MIPMLSASSIAAACTLSWLISASHSCSKSTFRASATVVSIRAVLLGSIFSNIDCRSKSTCSIPTPVNIIGTALRWVVSSTRRCSNSPATSIARIFSRVRS